MDPESSRRIPKLAVRNRTYDNPTNYGDPASSASQQHVADEITAQRSTTEATAPYPEKEASMDTSRVSMSMSMSPQSPVKSGRKKKLSSVMGLLTLKEPSSNAFEQYAKQQRKQAAEKGGRTSTVGLPGVSSQKLPPEVPKVNSKWDGLPDSMKGRDSSKNKWDMFAPPASRAGQTDDGRRSTSTFSSGSSRGGQRSISSVSKRHPSDIRPPMSARSQSSSKSQKGNYSPAIAPWAEPVPHSTFSPVSTTSMSEDSLPTLSYYFPEEAKRLSHSMSATVPCSPVGFTPVTSPDGKRPNLPSTNSAPPLTEQDYDNQMPNVARLKFPSTDTPTRTAHPSARASSMQNFRFSPLSSEAGAEDTDGSSATDDAPTRRQSMLPSFAPPATASSAATLYSLSSTSTKVERPLSATTGPPSTPTSSTNFSRPTSRSYHVRSPSSRPVTANPIAEEYADGTDEGDAGADAPPPAIPQKNPRREQPQSPGSPDRERERLEVGGRAQRENVLPWEAVEPPAMKTGPDAAVDRKGKKLKVFGKR
ncbi:hypothetical protein K402DRAFT_418437 [Aulographum hederae CBS 113979]|uniref:Uncharacterized protein n=1 Tax=Aulographum hederae CBS 113979 TaxID=1176131 RepID=A0A6G1H940_9PEZI|nr:hypothetical protein K402DRAFT_418437 [Aulographum hederae CBS 113979]